MFKTQGRTAKPAWHIMQPADELVSFPVMNLVKPALKQITKVVIADDNPHARHGLRAVLASQSGIEIIGEASRGDEAIALVESLHPDVALMDVRMPAQDGIQAACIIKNHLPKTRIVLISMYADYQVEALCAGADVFLVKGCPSEELIAAIIGPQTNTARKAT